jgi:hypothetical protein
MINMIVRCVDTGPYIAITKDELYIAKKYSGVPEVLIEIKRDWIWYPNRNFAVVRKKLCQLLK